MTRAVFLAALLALAGCGGGDEPIADDQCAASGAVVPCRASALAVKHEPDKARRRNY